MVCAHHGDYFGRNDPFMRHRKRRPRVCQKAVSEKAEAKGRYQLDDGGDIEIPSFRIDCKCQVLEFIEKKWKSILQANTTESREASS
jgi:hypothetical protein